MKAKNWDSPPFLTLSQLQGKMNKALKYLVKLAAWAIPGGHLLLPPEERKGRPIQGRVPSPRALLDLGKLLIWILIGVIIAKIWTSQDC